jgi:hypothetical protein
MYRVDILSGDIGLAVAIIVPGHRAHTAFRVECQLFKQIALLCPKPMYGVAAIQDQVRLTSRRELNEIEDALLVVVIGERQDTQRLRPVAYGVGTGHERKAR